MERRPRPASRPTPSALGLGLILGIAASCSQPTAWFDRIWEDLPTKARPEPAGRCPTPSADLPSGTSLTPISVSLSCPDPSALIRYTTDGSVPGTGSTLYAAPIPLPYGSSMDLRARAWSAGLVESEVLVAGSYIVPTRSITPSLLPAAGTYDDPVNVTMSADPGAEIWYARTASAALPALPVQGGGPPSTLYVAGDPLLTVGYGATRSYRAVAWLAGHDGSLDSSATYHVRSWTALGSPGLALPASTIDLAIDGSGSPLIAYLDAVPGRAVVAAWDGSAWSLLGSGPVSTGASSATALALDASGNPLLAYTEPEVPEIPAVLDDPLTLLDDESMPAVPRVPSFGYLDFWDGAAWAGPSQPFSVGDASLISLAFDGSQPLVSWSDAADTFGHVASYAGAAFAAAGAAPFPDGLGTTDRLLGLAAAGDLSWNLVRHPLAAAPASVYRLAAPPSGSWTQRGGGPVQAGATDLEALALDSSSMAWLAFADLSDLVNPERAKVVRENGGAWTVLASTASTNPVTALAIAINPLTDLPWMAVAEKTGPTTVDGLVYRWSGSAWVSMGGGFVTGAMAITALDLAFDSGGLPQLAWIEGSTGQLQVMAYQ